LWIIIALNIVKEITQIVGKVRIRLLISMIEM